MRKRSKINKDNLSIAVVKIGPKKQRTEKRLIVIISSAVFNYVINNFLGEARRRGKNREMKIALNGNSKASTRNERLQDVRGYSNSRDKKTAPNISHTIGWLNWKESAYCHSPGF